MNQYNDAVRQIKTAILRSQAKALASVNQEQLALYYCIGRYISHNSRSGFWGKDAIETISRQLSAEMPGLRGFSPRNLRNMRMFYEQWQLLDSNLAVATAKLKTSEDEDNTIHQLQLTNYEDFPVTAFFGHWLHSPHRYSCRRKIASRKTILHPVMPQSKPHSRRYPTANCRRRLP